MVRKLYQQKYRLDSSPIANVMLNLKCRDEIESNMIGLQYFDNNNKLRRKAVR